MKPDVDISNYNLWKMKLSKFEISKIASLAVDQIFWRVVEINKEDRR